MGGGTKAYELRSTGEPLCYDCACGFPKRGARPFTRVSSKEDFHTLILPSSAPPRTTTTTTPLMNRPPFESCICAICGRPAIFRINCGANHHSYTCNIHKDELWASTNQEAVEDGDTHPSTIFRRLNPSLEAGDISRSSAPPPRLPKELCNHFPVPYCHAVMNKSRTHLVVLRGVVHDEPSCKCGTICIYCGKVVLREDEDETSS